MAKYSLTIESVEKIKELFEFDGAHLEKVIVEVYKGINERYFRRNSQSF